MEYLPRIADKILEERLEAKAAVLIEGSKWCGKTTTAELHSKSVIYLNHPDFRSHYMELGNTEPSLLLEGEPPLLIDEWQLIPSLWDAIRFEADKRRSFGQFILTGSAVPADEDQITHTGTGRITRMLMRPMSLYESRDSSGEVSLEDLFNNKVPSAKNDKKLDEIAFLIARGGWPMAIAKSEKVALRQAKDYYEGIINSDISRVDGIGRDKERAKLLMKSYARNIGTQASVNVIRNDISSDESLFSLPTLYSYIAALKKIFVIEDASAWNPNLRSKTAIRTSDTRYFVDPSIAAAALGLGPSNLLKDLSYMGYLFENLCIRDLRIYADYLGASLYHYRDKSDLECDAVIHLEDGRYGLIEIKLGGERSIEEAAANLKVLKSKLDVDKMNEPSFMMVLNANSPFAYKREDGVLVVPIGALKY